ncbi:MAG: hypothetical protein H7287_05640 [Thermoleophilia bacterium]|nr:hypothetical protein [Thermoleophilia bacterium]
MVRLPRTTSPLLLLIALTITALALLAAAGSARAAITPIAPAPDSASLRSDPAFSWAVDGDSVVSSLQVAAYPALDPVTGKLVAPVIDQGLAAGATTFTPGSTLQLFAGTWYWRVVGTTGEATAGTDPRVLKVMPQVAPPRLKLTAARNGTTAVAQLRTNAAKYTLRVRIFHGRTACFDKVVTGIRKRARIAVWDAFKVYCYPFGGVKAGTRAKVIITVTANGVTRTTTRLAIVA